LLADHAGIAGLDRRLIRSSFEWVSLFNGTKESNALSVAPLLVRVEIDSHNLRDRALIRCVLDSGAFSSCLMFLSSPLSMNELATRLTARLEAKISGDIEVLLPFFDPRVFAQLVHTLSEEQRDEFLCPASCWWYVDRGGDLRTVPTQFSTTDTASPLVLSPRQEFELLDASEPDQIEEQVRSLFADEFGRLPIPQRHAFIAEHSAAGRAYRITSIRELALFCGLALVYGAHFASTPEWSKSLALISQSKQTLRELVANLKFQD
jgi:hypothetical protein